MDLDGPLAPPAPPAPLKCPAATGATILSPPVPRPAEFVSPQKTVPRIGPSPSPELSFNPADNNRDPDDNFNLLSAPAADAPSAETQSFDERTDVGQFENPGEGSRWKAWAQFVAPRAALLLVALVWGTNFGSVKIMQQSVPPGMAAALRFSIAGLALLPFVRSATAELWHAALPIGLAVFSGYFTQSISLRIVEANTSSFLCALTVLVVPVLNALFARVWAPAREEGYDVVGEARAEARKKRRVNPWEWIAPLVAVGGVALLELSPETSAFGVGDVWGLAQSVCFALGFVLNERVVGRFPDFALPLAAIQVLTVAGCSVVWAVAEALGGGAAEAYGTHGAVAASILNTPQVVAFALYTGLVTTAGSIVVETVALKEVSAAELALLLSTEPVWAALFSATLLGEKLGKMGWIGGALVVTACLLRQLGRETEVEGGAGAAQQESLL